MRRRKLCIEHLEDRRVMAADFNGNNTVDAADLGIWKTNFGTVNTATQAQGDSDADRDVDGADFLAWQRTLGQSIPPLDISIGGLSEANETSPGAIVFRNSDFSKQSLATIQPEPGLPLYVPDYAAPASVYDPNAAADFTASSVTIQAGMVGTHSIRFVYDTTKVRLWTTSNWTGLVAAGGGRFYIPSGVNLTPNNPTLAFQMEGLANSTAFATDSIQVQAIPTGGGATLTDEGRYTVVEVNAGVDGNRDTAIDFTNSHDRQMLFWLNSDREGFHVSDTFVEAEDPNIPFDPDQSDNVISQRRDLEDFAPLRFNVPSILLQNAENIGLENVPTGQLSSRYSFELLDTNGESIRFFLSNNYDADVYKHVNDEEIADIQVTEPTLNFATARTSLEGARVLETVYSGLNPLLFEMWQLNPTYGIPFASTPTLVFVTEVFYPDGSSVEKRHEIDLDIRDIKSLYTRWEIPYEISPTQDLRTDVSFEHYATPTTPLHASQIQNVPFFSGPDTTVLVHGWNMTDEVNNDWKAAYAETMFKRLYWQGYRGEFVSFDWPTFADDEGPREWPIVGTGANLTYNASDFQAYRSAQALRNILEDYRQPSNLQPLHLLAHSMGNQVAGEALRQWAVDPNTVDPLVTNYIAMQAAVSAGAYKDNGTDSNFPGRPVPDLYRFFQHGRNGLTDPGLGNESYYQSNGFSWENSVNYYNEQDFALDLWDDNNVTKELGLQSPVWPYDYDFEPGDGENINNDIFTRQPDVGPDVILDLALPNGRPGPNAYEILAFFSQSATLALGTGPVAPFDPFDDNVDLETFGMFGGSDIRANHSYQFNHDAAETWDFYERLKADLQFDATYSVPAIVSASHSSLELPQDDRKSHERLDWFLEPIIVSSQEKRAYVEERVTYEPRIGSGSPRLAALDAYFEKLEKPYRRWAVEPPLREVPETLEVNWESLGQG